MLILYIMGQYGWRSPVHAVTESVKETWKKMYEFSVSTVPDDDQAPFGARVFACTLMTKSGLHIW